LLEALHKMLARLLRVERLLKRVCHRLSHPGSPSTSACQQRAGDDEGHQGRVPDHAVSFPQMSD
jgi:hypothetical protein